MPTTCINTKLYHAYPTNGGEIGETLHRFLLIKYNKFCLNLQNVKLFITLKKINEFIYITARCLEKTNTLIAHCFI